jgi:hypothetical protein
LYPDGSAEQTVERAVGVEVGPQRAERQRFESNLEIELPSERRCASDRSRPATPQFQRGFDLDGPIQRFPARHHVDVSQLPRDRGIHSPVFEYDLGVAQLERANRQGDGGAAALERRALGSGRRIRGLGRQRQCDAVGRPHEPNGRTIHHQGVHHQRACQQWQQGDAQGDALGLHQRGFAGPFPRQPRLLHQ